MARTRVLAPVRGPYLYGLLLLTGLLLAAVYQSGTSYRWEMGDEGTSAYVVDFYGVEHAGPVGFRWAAPRAGLRAPGVGSFAGVAHLQLNGDPWGGPQRIVTVQIGADPPVPVRLDPGWHEYTVPFTGAPPWPGDLVIQLNEPELQIPPAQRAPQDTRRLGVPVAAIAVESTSRPIIPPLGILAGTLLGVGLVYALAVWVGTPRRIAAILTTALAVAWAALLGGWRLPAILAAPGLLFALVWAVALALVLRAGLGALFRRGGVVMLPAEGAVLVGLFVLDLVIKVTGLLDPLFAPIDQYAKLHELMRFGDDPLYYLQHLLDFDRSQPYGGQLDLSTTLPYSPLFYILFSPLNWLLPDPNMRLRALYLISGALEGSDVFLLFYTLKRAWGDGVAGVWAGAIFIALPLTNLPFSDGSYPGIFGTWCLVLLIATLAWATPFSRTRPGAYVALVVLLALTLLAHPANAIMLGATLLVFLVLVARADPAQFRPVVGWVVAGSALAFLAFYQFTLERVFVEVLPQMLNRLHTVGGVGKNQAKLGAPLLSGFWPQIQAHFRTWPVALALTVFPGSWVRSRGQSPTPNPRLLRLWLVATALTFAVFSVGDLWINLLQKHMIYAMPALALLNGLALAALWRRGRVAQALCVALWLALFAAALGGWVARVVAYVLPPGTG